MLRMDMSPQKKVPRKRVEVLVPTEIYEQLESIADKRNCTITLVVIQAILKRIRDEAIYD